MTVLEAIQEYYRCNIEDEIVCLDETIEVRYNIKTLELSFKIVRLSNDPIFGAAFAKHNIYFALLLGHFVPEDASWGVGDDVGDYIYINSMGGLNLSILAKMFPDKFKKLSTQDLMYYKLSNPELYKLNPAVIDDSTDICSSWHDLRFRIPLRRLLEAKDIEQMAEFANKHWWEE